MASIDGWLNTRQKNACPVMAGPTFFAETTVVTHFYTVQQDSAQKHNAHDLFKAVKGMLL